jgi:hypothetical protein
MQTIRTVPSKLIGPPQQISLPHGNYALIFPCGEVHVVNSFRRSIVVVDPFGDIRRALTRIPDRSERGSILVELALALPFILLLGLGSLDLCWDLTAKSNLNWIATQSASCTKNPSCDPIQLAADNAGGLTMDTGALNVVVDGNTVTASYSAHGLVGFLPPINMQSSATAAP